MSERHSKWNTALFYIGCICMTLGLAMGVTLRLVELPTEARPYFQYVSTLLILIPLHAIGTIILLAVCELIQIFIQGLIAGFRSR